ncbi:hypothetical protein JCM11491_001928 [Sporobolomyces phaffii]
MKRTYNSSGPPAQNPSTLGNPYAAATFQAQPQLVQTPPLPPGQPPPPPNVQGAGYSPYAAYAGPVAPGGAGQQQQVAQHPQYPGYGYGGQPPQPAQAAPAPAAAAPQDAAAAAYAAQYAAYYAAYAQAAQVQASAASPYPPAGAAAQPQSAPTYPIGPAPPQYHQQAAQPVHSQGAPPYKRTRYDQPPLPQAAQPPLPPGPPPPMPPSILPPVGGRGPPRGPPSTFGGPPSNGRGPPMHNSRDHQYPSDHSYGGGGAGGGRGLSPGPSRGPGGGRGPRMGGNGPPSMSMGPPLPSGPRGSRSGPSGYARDDRGGPSRGSSSRSGPISSGPSSTRPLSGLPGSHKYSAPRGSGGGAASIPNAPKGPKSLANSSMTSSPRRAERKWGISASNDTRKTSDRDRERDRDRDRDRDGEGGKRTLTDFRIEGLEIEELSWKWTKAEEKVEEKEDKEEAVPADAVANAEEAKTNEGGDEEKDDARSADIDADSSAQPGNPEERETLAARDEVDQDDDTAADMSIDAVAAPILTEEATAEVQPPLTSDDPASDSVLPASTVAKGKHARPEDDSATEDSANEEEKVRKERESKAKKVKVEKADAEEEATPIDTEVGHEDDTKTDKLGAPSDPPSATAPAPSKSALPQLTHPLPSKPVTIPTGPKSAHAPPPARTPATKARSPTPAPPPPPSRENSRLRIYFSSPIPLPASSSAAPPRHSSTSSMPRDRDLTPKTEDKGRGEPVPTPAAAPKESDLGFAAVPSEVAAKIEEVKEEEGEQDEEENVDGEDIDGEDIDGAALDGEALEEAEENFDGEPAAREAKASGDADQQQDQESPKAELETEQPAQAEENVASEQSTAHDADPASAQAPPSHTLVVPPPEPTADRISISYARNTRRMVIDAEVVESVKIFRSSGKIEVVVNCEPSLVGIGEQQIEDEYRICKGILVEALDPEADDYIVMDRASLEDAWRQHERSDPESIAPAPVNEPLLPPLHHFLTHPSPNEEPTLSIVPSTSFNRPSFTIVAQLDRANPLTEARWVKTGEVENWILSLGIANGQDPKDPEKLSKWLGKIDVVDPDEPPTIQHALDSWATSSNIGSLGDRKEFVKTHMSNIDNVVEILLRLSRGERSGPPQYSSSSYAQPSTVGALATQLSAPFPMQQTQVSLAILAMFRLTVETAEKAGIDKSEIEKQVSEIIRNVPYHLQFKALDGMFREVYKTKVPAGKGSKGASGRSNRGGSGGSGIAHGRRD